MSNRKKDVHPVIYLLTSVMVLIIGIALLPKLTNYISASIYKFQNKLK